MEQEEQVDDTVRRRLRGLRLARGWSLDALAVRCHMSPSTLSRIETGGRRIALDQLVILARALDTSLDALLEPEGDHDVVIRPEPSEVPGWTAWRLSREGRPPGMVVAKLRSDRGAPTTLPEPQVHPGREWLTVLEGALILRLGDREVVVRTGEAAEFSTMVPHAMAVLEGPVEVLTVFDQAGERAHLRASRDAPS